MGRYILPILVLLGGISYWGYSTWRDYRLENIKEASEKANAQNVKLNILQIAERYKAVTNWPDQLVKSGSDPVFSVDLQKLWMIERPILFIGRTEDISCEADGTFTFTISNSLDYGKDSHIRLIAVCNSSTGSALLASIKNEESKNYGDNIALIVNIYKIKSINEPNSDGSIDKILTGYGLCLEGVTFSNDIPW